MAAADGSLYDDDFYAWTQEQAELLRRLPAVSNRLDSVLIAAKIDLPVRYRYALRLLHGFDRTVPGFMARIPTECPYSLDQILGSGDEDWFLPVR
jgi:hypothetical protein